MREPLLEAPSPDDFRIYETLGYIEGHDAVSKADYAFVAYKEIDRATGAWRVVVRGNRTAGGTFEPAAIRHQAQQAAARGQPFFKWAYALEPTTTDVRQLEFRVHQFHGEPRQLEIYFVLRNPHGSAAPAYSLRFDWPAG